MIQLVNNRYAELTVLVVAVLGSSLLAIGVTSVEAVKNEQDVVMNINSVCVGSAAEDWGFVDVAAGSAYAGAINCLAYYGIGIGTGDGSTFSPDADVKRWQMALFMQRAATVTGIALEDPVDQGFVDIAMKGQSVREAINQVVAAGIMTGNGATETQTRTQTRTRTLFDPDANVSRADMAMIIIRWLAEASDQVEYDDATNDYEIYKPGYTTAFVPDDRLEDTITTVNAAQYNAILALYELGVVNATSPGMFSPGKNVKRYQMASFITRALDFTTVRPEGVTIVPANDANNSFIVSVRDTEFQPLSNQFVDAFYVTGEMAQAFKDDGTCDTGFALPVKSGSNACRIDHGDYVSDANGIVNLKTPASRNTGPMTIWVWTAALNSTVDKTTHLMAYTITEVTPTGTTATYYKLTSDLNTYAKYAHVGSEHIATLQLLDSNTSNALPVAESGWQFNIQITTYKQVATSFDDIYGNVDITNGVWHYVRSLIVETDSHGMATFPFGGALDGVTAADIDTDTTPRDTPLAVIFTVRSCRQTLRSTGITVCGTTDNTTLQNASLPDLKSLHQEDYSDPNHAYLRDDRNFIGVLFISDPPELDAINIPQFNSYVKLNDNTTRHSVAVIATDQYGNGVFNLPITLKQESTIPDTVTISRPEITKWTGPDGMVTIDIPKPLNAARSIETFYVWDDVDNDGHVDENEEDYNSNGLLDDHEDADSDGRRDSAEVSALARINWMTENTLSSKLDGIFLEGVIMESNTLVIMDFDGLLSYMTYDSNDRFKIPKDLDGDWSIDPSRGELEEDNVTMDEFERWITGQLSSDPAPTLHLKWNNRRSSTSTPPAPPYNDQHQIVEWVATY